jgi:hypothetical protein
VYDFGSTPDGTLYIAMEFVAGRPLSDVLVGEGKLTSDRVIQIFRQICGALDEAHQLGIVHRDLKPDNIILTPRAGEQDFVKVLDFGIAARTESADAAHEQKLTQQGTVLGTPPYMSPEQFTGKPLDRRSDVYSLGVMAYEMLTGKLPFDAETPWQWATQHMTAQPRPFEVVAPQIKIADGVRQAILRALSKEADQRQPSAGQFITELSAGLRAGADATPIGGRVAALPYQATAAMPEVPGFGGSPAMSPAAYSPGAKPVASTVANAAVSPAAAMPMIAAPRSRGGGKTGLVLGLSGAGVVAVAVLVIVLVRSNKPTDDPSVIGSVASVSSASMAPATLSAEIPQVNAGQVPVQMPQPIEPTLPNTQQRKGPAKTTTAAATGSAATVAPQVSSPPPVVPTPSAVTTPPVQPTQPPAQNNAACDSCLAAASNGDMSSAGRYLAQCTDSSAKQRCVDRARSSAMRAAKGAVTSHDCAKAAAIRTAANAIGAGSPQTDAIANSCK